MKSTYLNTKILLFVFVQICDIRIICLSYNIYIRQITFLSITTFRFISKLNNESSTYILNTKQMIGTFVFCYVLFYIQLNFFLNSFTFRTIKIHNLYFRCSNCLYVIMEVLFVNFSRWCNDVTTF